MTSSFLKISISYIITAILASLLTTVFVKSHLPQRRNCKLDKAALGRDVDKIPLCKEEKKKPSKKNDQKVNKTSNEKIEKVLLKNSTKGVCLDGSPAGYRFRKGFGKGKKKWILFFNGGAWCDDELACYQRSHGAYGSSHYKTWFPHTGLYSTDSNINPDFYNWNVVFIIYCDGASFTGMREKPVYFKKKPVYYRGRAILDAIVQDLLDRGARNASDVLLTGSSAGSLAVLIHADYIKNKLNPRTKVRAISDSGYFVDLETQYGTRKTRKMFQRMLSTHNSTASLHQGCVRRMRKDEKWKCIFPQYFFKFIKTPVFILQSAYDVWQIFNNLAVVCTIPSYEDILQFFPRGSPLFNPAHDHYPSSTHRETFRNMRASISTNNPGFQHSPLEIVVGTYGSRNKQFISERFFGNQNSWNNYPVIAADTRRSNLPYTKIFNSPTALQDFGQKNQKNPDIARTFPLYNARSALRAAYSPGKNTARGYSAIPANVAHFRQKRDSSNVQLPIEKSRSDTNTLKRPVEWHWQLLYKNPAECTRNETKEILRMRRWTLDALKPVLSKPGAGLFLSSCFEHTQALSNTIWKNGKINGKSPRDEISKWYFGKPNNHIHIGRELAFESCTV